MSCGGSGARIWRAAGSTSGTLAYVLSYALATSDIMKETLRDLALDAGLEAREINMDLITQPLILDALAEGEAKGMAEGEAKGRAEGEAKGKAEGRADLLLHLFRQRFGSIPEGVEVKVRSAQPPIWRHGRMPCLMRGSLTTSSRMEAPAERRTGAQEASCAGLAQSEAAARAAHRAAPGIPQRPKARKLHGPRSGRGRRTFAAAPAARPQRHKRGAILTTNLPTGGSRQPASASS